MEQVLCKSGGPVFKIAASDDKSLRVLPKERRAGDRSSCFHSVPDGNAEMHDPHNLGKFLVSHALNDASLAPAFQVIEGETLYSHTEKDPGRYNMELKYLQEAVQIPKYYDFVANERQRTFKCLRKNWVR